MNFIKRAFDWVCVRLGQKPKRNGLTNTASVADMQMAVHLIHLYGAQFQYSDRLIEHSNPQIITFSEVLREALTVLSWQPISLFISEHISSYSAYILINNCSFIWYRFCSPEMNTF